MDDEVTVMFQLGKTLEALDEESRARVIRWAADKFGVDVGQPFASGEQALGTEHQTMFIGIDPEKVAAAKAARESGESKIAASGRLSPESVAVEETPPARDPDKPSFLDTSFRMYSGKKELRKAKDEAK